MPTRTLGLQGGGLYNVPAFLVLVRMLGPEGDGVGGGPTSIGEKNECPARTLGLEGGGL